MVRRATKHVREVSLSHSSDYLSCSSSVDEEASVENDPLSTSPVCSDDNEFFTIHINERLARIAVKAPFINSRELFSRVGVLLQDVTVPECPVLLLPCPHSGRVTVQPARRYRLVKFIGEHLCLAGDFAPVEEAQAATKDQRRLESWAMSELLGMMNYLAQCPGKTADDFIALSPEEAGRYHTKGNAKMFPTKRCGRTKACDEKDKDEEDDDEDVTAGESVKKTKLEKVKLVRTE